METTLRTPMINVSSQEPEHGFSLLHLANIAGSFALAVAVGLVSYASVWVW